MAEAASSAPLSFDNFDKAKRMQGELTKRYFQRLLTAKEQGRKVGYAFVMANPIELFNVFDIVPLYPEITSLNISYRGGAPPLISLSEEMGYSTDACGYVKMGVASVTEGTSTSIGVLPKPDVLLLTFSGCQIYIHWWEQLHYQTGAEVLVVDVPYVRERDGKVPSHDVKYVASQLEESIPQLERVSGKKFRQACDIPKQQYLLYLRFRDSTTMVSYPEKKCPMRKSWGKAALCNDWNLRSGIVIRM